MVACVRLATMSVSKLEQVRVMADQEAIWASLESAAEGGGDLVPAIYGRLFAARPQVAQIFAVGAGENPNPAMGSMVNEILALVADGIDSGVLDATIMSTLINHLGWGIDIDLHRTLLNAIRDTVREASGSAWSDAMAAAWERRIALILDSLASNQRIIERPQHH